MLEYYSESKRSAWLSAPLPVAVLLGSAERHGGLAALSSWFTWLIACIVVAFIAYKGRSDVLTAGADWVQFNNHWVRTYELGSVRYVARAMGTRFALVFKDKTAPKSTAQHDPSFLASRQTAPRSATNE